MWFAIGSQRLGCRVPGAGCRGPNQHVSNTDAVLKKFKPHLIFLFAFPQAYRPADRPAFGLLDVFFKAEADAQGKLEGGETFYLTTPPIEDTRRYAYAAFVAHCLDRVPREVGHVCLPAVSA